MARRGAEIASRGPPALPAMRTADGTRRPLLPQEEWAFALTKDRDERGFVLNREDGEERQEKFKNFALFAG